MPLTRIEIILILSVLIIFILAMVTFIVVILFFVQKKQRGFVSDLKAVKANYDKELYKAQLEIQEQTFQDISREIHDNVGQILSLAKLGLGTLDLEKKEDTKASICEISDILEKALDDLRHLSRSMNAEVISRGGLKKSIEMQLGYIQRGGKFNTHFYVTGNHVRLDETKEIILFRITQEAVNNILKHATAKEISISLFYNKDFLKLEIEDNGKGFLLEEQNKSPHLINGIYNMQKRASLIEGKFEINSKVGKGTCITVTSPY